MTDVEKAKNILTENGYTCVLVRGDTVYTSRAVGISPMMDLLSAKTPLTGFSVADKVVGKAAALLFALAGVTDVYAEILSEQALGVFFKHNIRYSYGVLAKYIISRDGLGVCPMEKAVEGIDSPDAAFDAVAEKLKALKLNMPKG